MASLTVENYLKAILLLGFRSGQTTIATGQLAEALEVSPGTVTSMLKTLADSDLVNYKPYAGVTLTASGRKLALRMLRRHRLIELFLVNTLNLTWDQVHEEAEHMEHAVSDFLIDHIDEFLDHPSTDPHGDPIPGKDGELRSLQGQGVPLSSCEPGVQIKLIRVLNQSPEFLRYLSDVKLLIGANARIVQKSEEAGLLTLDNDGLQIPLGLSAAADLLVQPIEQADVT
ncbi:MAG: metal-dependent transcriptional regulator [Rubinisphaera brasiliensis]|uniref:Transcriptional regulator MntR n=1 Tax=Rubinisphaera brasiliensis (strain ATCC 49424 / DSM 5305 / JCM 21570 / IAM 15109 / NBRC 103401 / IFAM 1448) TaxID=756272 RepID=F0SNS8_RUBBR|nr:metal-dependent transcriptional regulator [Rubinisphaera brasiliensis]ADY58964.1 iron (metal) dependent repressor, DtxR family [Rubinisphaera brasiliensis DSM 5305]